jgi:16S rRNA (guanine966-N2)-methyltransferase
MRVIAGEAKGRRLSAPEGRAVRPSAARMRESAFGILAHRDAIVGARALDLFAGTGALGIEALSRGAGSLVAVEQAREAARVLLQNLEHCGFATRAEVIARPIAPALVRLGEAGRKFDLVLIDPPYGSGLIESTLASVVEFGLLDDHAWLLVEHSSRESVAPTGCLEPQLVRTYGSTAITLLAKGSREVRVHAIK